MAAMRTYLDHNATSPLRPQARAALLAALDAGGNASSVHAEGRKARALVEEARETIAAALGGSAGMVVFTASGTEANNLALKGAAAGLGLCRLVVSAVEHASVLEAAAATGLPVDVAPVTAMAGSTLRRSRRCLPAVQGRRSSRSWPPTTRPAPSCRWRK
jgi:cysteine desulfurase